MKRPVLCFEVWKNDKKLALAGVRESGVVTCIVSWVGKGAGASSLSAATTGPIPYLGLHIGGIDSSDAPAERHINWLGEEGPDLHLGDEIRIRLAAAEEPDSPVLTKPRKTESTSKDGASSIRCSFCGQMRKSEPAPSFNAGVAAADAFMCTRCLVLAECLLDRGLASLFHLSRTTNKTCSFCFAEHTQETATAQDTHICRACVDMILKDGEPTSS